MNPKASSLMSCSNSDRLIVCLQRFNQLVDRMIDQKREIDWNYSLTFVEVLLLRLKAIVILMETKDFVL